LYGLLEGEDDWREKKGGDSKAKIKGEISEKEEDKILFKFSHNPIKYK